MLQWKKKKVVVTGGAGFLGSYVVEKLKERGCENIIVPRAREFDLREKSAIIRLFTQTQPDVVIHLAAVVGGIGANMKNPGLFFYDNAIMGIQLIEFARPIGVEKFVAPGTICSYPKYTPVPFSESELWNGYPEETNAAYGLAKKMMLVQAQAYRQQYGFNCIYLLPVNLYGPRDNFDLESSHVIPALIRKCFEAKQAGSKEIVLWGDGTPTREFLYGEDAAEGILLAAERYDGAEPINLGSGEEISISRLATLIASLMDFKGNIVWDSSKPNGQPRRCLDVTKAREVLRLYREVCSCERGMEKTIHWYLSNHNKLKSASEAA